VIETVAFSEFIRIEDPGTEEEVIVFFHDWAGDTELHLPITSAVEELTDAPLQRIEAELRGSIDPDALERAFEPTADGTPREGGKLILLIESCEVTVHTDGWVEVARVSV
jgi:hypothetical protein